MDASHTTSWSFRQFSLQALLAATVFAALGLWAWRGFGSIGVVYFVAFVFIVVGNLVVALFGAKLGYPLLVGAAGGGVLWSIAVVWMGIPNALFLSGHAWFELGSEIRSGTDK